jgi:hypothetical protein
MWGVYNFTVCHHKIISANIDVAKEESTRIYGGHIEND